jgi:flavin-binding protein dodecin
MSETVHGIESAWVKEQKVVVDDGEVKAYRVTMKVTFIVK